MKNLIIYCHPHQDSHNAKILHHVTETLMENEAEYEVLDLYAMGFDPTMKEIEYDRMTRRIRETEPDIVLMQQKVMAADHLIFIYPVWWYNMPAMLKGFLDRVFCNGFAYRFFRVPRWQLIGATVLSFSPGLRYLLQPYSVTGLLKGKKAFIFRTYGGPPLGRRFFGNTSHKVLEQVILRFCGLTDITVHELYNCDKSVYTKAYEDQYLRKVRELVNEIFY